MYIILSGKWWYFEAMLYNLSKGYKPFIMRQNNDVTYALGIKHIGTCAFTLYKK